MIVTLGWTNNPQTCSKHVSNPTETPWQPYYGDLLPKNVVFVHVFCIQMNQKETFQSFFHRNRHVSHFSCIINCGHLEVTVTQPQTKFTPNTGLMTQQQ